MLVVAVYLLLNLPPCRGINIYVRASADHNCSGFTPCKTLDEYANDTEIFRGEIDMYFTEGGVYNLTRDLIINEAERLSMQPGSGPPRVAAKDEILLLGGDIVLDSLEFFIHALSITGTTKHGIVTNDCLDVDVWDVHMLTSFFTCTQSIRADPEIVTISLFQSTFMGGSEAGFSVSDERIRGDLTISIHNSQFSNNLQGGIVIDTSATLDVHIRQVEIMDNEVDSSGNGLAAALSINSITESDSSVNLFQVGFRRNQDLRGQPTESTVYVSGVSTLSVSACSFDENRGTAIRAENIKNGVQFVAGNTFINNIAPRGGAISLMSTQVYFMSRAQIRFENNHVYDVGGAIHVESSTTVYEGNNPNTRTECFYKFPEWDDQQLDYSIRFINNSAKNGGHHIYGASLKSYCVVYVDNTSETPYVRSNDPQIQGLFQFEGGENSPISSTPSRVCTLNPDNPNRHLNFSESCADISQIFMTKDLYPGEEFELEVVLVGLEFGSGTGDVFAQFLPINDEQPKLQSQFVCSQRINEPNSPKVFNYAVYSRYLEETLVLNAQGGKVSDYGDEDQIREDIEHYKSSGDIRNTLQNTPVYVNVSLRNCPSGFYLDCESTNDRCKCTCSKIICDNSNNQNEGEISKGKVMFHLWANSWVKVDNSGDILISRNCPFDYCEKNSTIFLNDSDSQCAMNHTGDVCGACRPGFSLALGSNECLECSNNFIALIVAFACAGITLVLFLKLLNMTVSQGTINGLIFYANIMWAYQNIFFSESHANPAPSALVFLKVFIAWINLDLGVKTCFAHGLTAYIKTWLQFLFPIYVWSIVGGMIFLANQSTRITKLFGNNLPQVLATLFLLSYVKLLRATITALIPATLLKYNDTASGDPSPYDVQYVWAFDGNLTYGHFPHVILLVAALLVLLILWLPYTFTLLFIQPLRKMSSFCCFRWINTLKPLFDAYTGPLNPQNHFWVGILLLTRFILLIVFALSYALHSDTVSLLALIVTVVLLLTILSYTGQLYASPTEMKFGKIEVKVSFRSIFEVSFLLNLAIVGGSVLYTNTVNNTVDNDKVKPAVVYTSVSIAFLQFLGIIMYHILCIVKKAYKRETLRFNDGYQNLEENREKQVTVRDVHISNTDNHSRYRSSRVREPLLTESKIH